MWRASVGNRIPICRNKFVTSFSRVERSWRFWRLKWRTTLVYVASNTLDPIIDCRGLVSYGFIDMKSSKFETSEVTYRMSIQFGTGQNFMQSNVVLCGQMQSPFFLNLRLVFNIFTHKWPTLYFLDVFAILWKATVSFVLSVCPSVRPSIYLSAWNNSALIGRILITSFRLWDNAEKCGGARQVTDDNLIRCVHFACCMSKLQTHSQNMKH
jgi:hypothetical protein